MVVVVVEDSNPKSKFLTNKFLLFNSNNLLFNLSLLNKIEMLITQKCSLYGSFQLINISVNAYLLSDCDTYL